MRQFRAEEQGTHLRTCLQATLVIQSCAQLCSPSSGSQRSLASFSQALPEVTAALRRQRGKNQTAGPHFPSRLSVSNSDHSTLIACLRVCATRRRSPQKPALLFPSAATENDVGTPTRGRRRTGQAEDHISMMPPETRQARTPAARSAITDRKNCLVRMGGGGERISLSQEFSNQSDPEGPAAAQESASPHVPKRVVSAATKLCSPVFPTPSTQRLLW